MSSRPTSTTTTCRAGASWPAVPRARLVLPAAAGVAFDHLPAFHTRGASRRSGGDPTVAHPRTHARAHELRGPGRGGGRGGFLGRKPAGGLRRAARPARRRPGVANSPGSNTCRSTGWPELPDETGLYPTHGEGSFCTASGAGRTDIDDRDGAADQSGAGISERRTRSWRDNCQGSSPSPPTTPIWVRSISWDPSPCRVRNSTCWTHPIWPTIPGWSTSGPAPRTRPDTSRGRWDWR